MSTALGITLVASLGYAAFGAVGCTVVTSDAPLTDAAGTDTLTPPTDSGVDTAIGTDTSTPDTSVGFAVVIPAAVLIGGVADDVRDFGGGSTKTDIITGGRVWNAFATAGGKTSTEIGKDSTDKLIDGKIFGLPAGTAITITVTANLRGLNGDGPDPGTQTVPWATATCTATPSATADVIATCTRKKADGTSESCVKGCLQLIPGLKGIVFTADVLPDGYCDGKGKTAFELTRARQPFGPGAVTTSRTVSDCKGVIWVPADKVTETAAKSGISDWGLSLETTAPVPCSGSSACRIDRNTKPGGCAVAGEVDCLDVFVVGNECQLTNASTGGTCF
ncbi:MAG: hypothetical protein ABI175_09970 [Polyangiales bacterium]